MGKRVRLSSTFQTGIVCVDFTTGACRISNKCHQMITLVILQPFAMNLSMKKFAICNLCWFSGKENYKLNDKCNISPCLWLGFYYRKIISTKNLLTFEFEIVHHFQKSQTLRALSPRALITRNTKKS